MLLCALEETREYLGLAEATYSHTDGFALQRGETHPDAFGYNLGSEPVSLAGRALWVSLCQPLLGRSLWATVLVMDGIWINYNMNIVIIPLFLTLP